jgi:predicted O-methyltransferase YrrM
MIPKNVKKILRSEKRLMFIPLKFAVAKLKWTANRCNSIEDYVNLTFNTSNSFPCIKPGQVREEITELLKILARRKPMFILEVGTAGGGTLFSFARVSSPDALIISIDLPGGRFGGGYPEWRVPLYKSFAIHKQKICLIRENSHAFSTLKMVEKGLEGHKLDFLFIDGDHRYDGVKTDFEMYGKLVGKGGIIAFHDIVSGPPENVGGVPRFWDEIKHNFGYIELVKDWKQSGCGIGIVYVRRRGALLGNTYVKRKN